MRPVIPQRVFIALVGGLAILVVAFAVLMGFYALIGALGDAPAARALLWAATSCLILLVMDLVLLVGALGVQTLQQNDEDESEE